MNLYAGSYDFIVFGLLLILNIFLWNRGMKNKSGCMLVFIVFGLVLPLLSIAVEIRLYHAYTIDKPFSDKFETVYTLYRFPLYWLIGIVQFALIALKNKFNIRKN